MSDPDLAALTAQAFTALADVLEVQPTAAWDAQSLCEQWRVRDVVAHVTNAARYDPPAYMAEVQADGGDFGATTDRLALRDGELDPEVLLANLRDERLHHWIPPGGDQRGALSHVVIHGLDVTMPLGVGRWLPDQARQAVLDVLTRGGVHAHFGTNIEGARLEATDLDWAFGEGRAVSAGSEALILVLAGRDLPPGSLQGTLPSQAT